MTSYKLILLIAVFVCFSYATPFSKNYDISKVQTRIKRSEGPRFAIGLGTLSPSYSQKLGGGGRLDFNHKKNGFSYSLSNVDHLTNLHSGESQNKEVGNNKDQSFSNLNTNYFTNYQNGYPNLMYNQGMFPNLPQMSKNYLKQLYEQMNGLYMNQPMSFPNYPSTASVSNPSFFLPTYYNPRQFYRNLTYPNNGKSAYNLSKKHETKLDLQSTQKDESDQNQADNGLMNFNYNPFLPLAYPLFNPYYSPMPNTFSSQSNQPALGLNSSTNSLAAMFGQHNNATSTMPNFYNQFYSKLSGASSTLSPDLMLEQPFPNYGYNLLGFENYGNYPMINSASSISNSYFPLIF